MLSSRFIAIALLLWVTHPQHSIAEGAPPPLKKVVLKSGGLEREFLAYVPKLNGGRHPVVFLFHGGGGSAAGMERMAEFLPIAQAEGIVAIYPQATRDGWNDGRNDRRGPHGSEDLEFFDDMVGWASQTCSVDPQRIYGIGMSNGAIFCHHLALNRSQILAAIAPVAGGFPVWPMSHPKEIPGAVSVLIVHGTLDRFVPYKGGEVMPWGRRARGEVLGAIETSELWAKLNGGYKVRTNAELPQPHKKTQTDRRLWRTANGAEIGLFTIHRGGHTWPGGKPYLPPRIIGETAQDLSSKDIWEFLKRQKKKAP